MAKRSSSHARDSAGTECALASERKALRVPGKDKGRFRPCPGFNAELPYDVLALSTARRNEDAVRHAAFIWWDNGRLPRRVTVQIQQADEVYVSAVTAWEIAIKSALGKITARGTVADAIADSGFSPLPITIEHADAVGSLSATIAIRSIDCSWSKLV